MPSVGKYQLASLIGGGGGGDGGVGAALSTQSLSRLQSSLSGGALRKLPIDFLLVELAGRIARTLLISNLPVEQLQSEEQNSIFV